MLLCILDVFLVEYYFGREKMVLGPISWGNTGFNKVRQASLLKDFSEPLIVNRDFDLLRRGPGV